MQNKTWVNKYSFTSAFVACLMMAFTTGCASGGYQLTRSYATWVNSNGTVVRVILYLFTFIVFFVTMLIDLVVNNTVDFWNGTVSQGIYKFYHDGNTFVAHHEILPDSKLKRSTIQVLNSENKLLQTVVFRETSSGEIELYVNGQLRTRVQHISKIPVASIFDKNGKKIEERILNFNTAVAKN